MRKALLLVAAVMVAGALSCSDDGTGPSESGSRQIVFASRDEMGVWDIFAVNADGSGLHNLTRSDVEDVYPAWNRARTRIAFRSAQQPGGVFVMDARGSGMQPVYNEPDAFIEHLTWSPDGESLAMAGIFLGTWQIRRVDLDGSASRVLIDVGSAPDWSPDGALIAFHMLSDSWDHIHVMNAADGTNVRNLTADRPGFHVDPSWSPDGLRIAYASGTGPFDVNIWVMNADGSNPVQLSTGGGEDRVPVWSRDGQQIAFQRNTSIWAMNADGSNQHSVTPSLEISGHPAW